MEKIVRDGKVAILVSPGFGAGWSTWNSEYDEEGVDLVFNPRIVNAVLGDQKDLIPLILKEMYPDKKIYTGGLKDLEVQWLPVGTKFYLHEYNGNESLWTEANLNITA